MKQDRYADMQELVDEAIRQIYPDSDHRGHDDYLANREVHVSLLVQKTAEEAAKTILGEAGRPDDERLARFWGFRGDGLGVAMSWDIAMRGHRELEVRKPIANGWVRAGSMDGLALRVDNGAVVLDWKTHAFPKKGVHDEAAWRQEMLYAATWWWEYQQGKRVWYPNEGEVRRYQQMLDLLVGKGLAQPRTVTKEELAFHAPDGLRFAGVASRIVGSFPEQTMLPANDESVEQLEKVEAFYHSKELAIVEAVETRDTDIARSWDKVHPIEHFRLFKRFDDPPVEVHLALKTLYEARKQFNAAKAANDEARAELAQMWVLPTSAGGIDVGNYNLDAELEASVSPPDPRWALPCPRITFRELADKGRGDDYER